MEFIRLQRKTIINNKTPLIVIDYLCFNYNISEKLTNLEKIDRLNEYEFDHVSSKGSEWTEKDWKKIARFVNPNVSWELKNLYQAFVHILQDPKYKVFGEKNNYNPEIGDLIDAYNECLRLNIEIPIDISYNTMTTLIFLYSISTEYCSLLNTNIPKRTILEAFYQNDLSVISPPLDLDITEPNFPPKSEYDAFYAALKKNIDLSLADCKLVEYYRPNELYISETLQKVNKVNPYRLKIGHYFNPRIPREFYTDQQINEMAILEGISADTNEKYENLLELSYLNNFHHLLQPEVNQVESLYLKEPFEDINPLTIVSYGVLSFFPDEFKRNNLTGYTISELSHMFKSNKNFTNEILGDKFPDHAINKLERICRGLLHNSKVIPNVKADCTLLLQTIEITREIERNDREEIKLWVSQVNPENINYVVLCLQTLMKAGFYMRKWDGTNNLPINIVSKEPLTEAEEDKVYAEIKEFEKIDNEIGNLVSKMPLIKHEFNNFQIITDKFEGQNIAERLEIVKKGNTVNEMSSCIKCSSNLIITSGYYYLLMINEPIKVFNIKDLRYVSE